MTKAREICIKRRNKKRMSIFTIIIQYCLAVLANANRQGKEKRGINIGDKAFLFADKNQIRTIGISKKARKLGSYKCTNKTKQ